MPLTDTAIRNAKPLGYCVTAWFQLLFMKMNDGKLAYSAGISIDLFPRAAGGIPGRFTPLTQCF